MQIVPEVLEEDPRLSKIYHLGENRFWSPTEDIDWDLPFNDSAPRYFRWAWRHYEPFMDMGCWPASAQDVINGYSYWAYPSPTWEEYGFPDDVNTYWKPFYALSRLRAVMIKAFQDIGLDVAADRAPTEMAA